MLIHDVALCVLQLSSCEYISLNLHLVQSHVLLKFCLFHGMGILYTTDLGWVI